MQENADHQAWISAAQANVAIAKASMDRVINGARASEREEAAAVVREAEAVMASAEREVARQWVIAEKQVGSGQVLDDAHSNSDVVRAQLPRARARLVVVDSPARVNGRERAEAELAQALARLEKAHAVFEKS